MFRKSNPSLIAFDCPFVSTNAEEQHKLLRNPSFRTPNFHHTCKGDLPIVLNTFWDSTGGGGTGASSSAVVAGDLRYCARARFIQSNSFRDKQRIWLLQLDIGFHVMKLDWLESRSVRWCSKARNYSGSCPIRLRWRNDSGSKEGTVKNKVALKSR